jgi:predicted nicotinamide N-methyase
MHDRLSQRPLTILTSEAAVRFERWRPRGVPSNLDAAARAALIREVTSVRRPAFTPEIALWLAEEPFTVWQRTEEAVGGAELPPPYWAFAWAGGLALARYLLDHPGVVAGREVLDVAAGSGIVAIAAALGGAARVVANDIDPFANAAVALNAELNGVTVERESRDLLDERPAKFDVVLAGDIFYELATARRMLRFLEGAEAAGAQVWVGDLGRSHLPKRRLIEVATYEVPVEAALEDRPVKRTTVWRLRTGSGAEIGYT